MCVIRTILQDAMNFVSTENYAY